MFTRFLAGPALCAALLLAPAVAFADDGHNHDAAPAASTGPALPRFSAASELFELVGVVNGKELKVYLDRFSDNSPVKGAKIELQVGGAPVALEEHGEGEFEGTLAQPLAPGVTPVTATIAADNDTDILGGELDVHEEEHAAATGASRWRGALGWTAAAAVLLLVLAWLGRRSHARRARLGGAA